jgi:hypothetical protein
VSIVERFVGIVELFLPSLIDPARNGVYCCEEKVGGAHEHCCHVLVSVAMGIDNNQSEKEKMKKK